MIELHAIYEEISPDNWTAHIEDIEWLVVPYAPCQGSAQLFLEKMIAEELPASSKRRVQWDIGKTTIIPYATKHHE